MSGDVQPRKRREKKKKKEDGTEDVVFQQQPQTTTSPIVTEDLNIHLHKEASTGGGLCAKFVFFILLTALTTLIGLIITEHRGLTDLDTIDTESRFAQLFEGWIDTPSIDHESEEELSIEQSEEHVYEEEDHEEEEDDEEQDQSLDHDNDEEDEEESEEQATDENVTNEENYEEESELQDDTIENESEEVSNENDDENEDEVEEDEDEQEVDDDEEEEQEYASEDEEISDGDRDASSLPTKEDVTQEDEEESKEDKYEQEDSEEAVDKTAETEESKYRAESDEIADSAETADQTESEEGADGTESEEAADRTESEEARSFDDADEVATKKTDDKDTTEKTDSTSKTAKTAADTKETITKIRQEKRAEPEKKKTVEASENLNEPQEIDNYNSVKGPSGNVPEDSDSENEKDRSKHRSGAQAFYDFENITNSNDWQIREELDRAQQNLANDAAYALTLFNKILERNPSSPRAFYGKAQSLDILAEEKRSNDLLQQAIASYQQVLKIREVPDALFQMAAERCIDRMRFKGLYGQAVPIHKLLIEKFPKDAKFANHLAVTYLTTNKINEARKILYETLLKWPNDGFALVHYGFILKTNDNNLERAVEFLQKGIETKELGVIDGRFYFHLGDALTRLGRKEEAMNVYSDGVANKVFLSKYQRALYNVERLTGKPWWKKEETPYVRFFEQLENNWKIIRDEGLSIMNQKGYFQPESENLRDIGEWKQFELYARGIKNSKNCKQCPTTCKIVETFPDAIGCRRGQIKFSVMHPGTHVWPHCGPTNCRLRTHLGLKVPSNTYIRVGEEIRSWEEGKLLIFDDSFEHEVWHNGTATRLVLIIDIWHPELTRKEKQSLSSI